MNRLFALPAVALVSAMLAATPAGAGAREEFTVVSGLPADHPAVRVFREHFRAAVAQRFAAAEDGAEVSWRPAYDGTIAHQGEVLEAISDGVGDIGIIPIDLEPRRLPLQDIGYQLPFTTTKCPVAANAYHAVHKSMIAMNTAWQNAGQIYLANITTDGYGLFANKNIKSIDDLRGLTIAVHERIEGWLSGVAAKPYRMPTGQIAGAVTDGAIDGAILPLSELDHWGLEQQLPNYLLTEFGPQTAYAVTINADRFAALSPPLREALLAAADDFVPRGAAAYCAIGDQLLAELDHHRIASQRFYRSRRMQWIEALPPLGRIWAAAREAEGLPGNDILTAYMDQIRAAGGQPNRDWDRDPAPSN